MDGPVFRGSVDYDENPDVFDLHIRLKEDHPADPVGTSDVVVVTIAISCVMFMFVFDIVIWCCRRYSYTVRTKNVPMIVMVSLASVIHILAVVRNYILFIPHRNVNVLFVPFVDSDYTETNDAGKYSWSVGTEYEHVTNYSSWNHPECKSTQMSAILESEALLPGFDINKIIDIGSGATGILGSELCVVSYFWLEYFFGLSFFMSLIALRMWILLKNCAKMVESLSHSRKKMSSRFAFVMAFLYPVFVLNTYITVHRDDRWTIFPAYESERTGGIGESESVTISLEYREMAMQVLRATLNSSPVSDYGREHTLHDSFIGADVDTKSLYEVQDTDFYETGPCYVNYRAVCNSPLADKLYLVGILICYGLFLIRLSKRLSTNVITFGYVSATYHTVYVCILLLIACGSLHAIHALPYWWGRDAFVLLVVFLHAFNYVRMIGTSLCEFCMDRSNCCKMDEKTEKNIEMVQLGAMTRRATGMNEMDSDIGVGDHDMRFNNRNFAREWLEASFNGNATSSTTNPGFNIRSRIANNSTADTQFLSTDPIAANTFYDFCIGKGKGLWMDPKTGIFHRKPSDEETGDGNKGVEVEQIVKCVKQLDMIKRLLDGQKAGRIMKDDLIGNINGAPRIDFMQYEGGELIPTKTVVITFISEFFLKDPVLDRGSPRVKRFLSSWLRENPAEWDSRHFWDLHEWLGSLLINEFSDDYEMSGMKDVVRRKKEEEEKNAFGTIRGLISEGIVSPEDLFQYLNESSEKEEIAEWKRRELDEIRSAFTNRVRREELSNRWRMNESDGTVDWGEVIMADDERTLRSEMGDNGYESDGVKDSGEEREKGVDKRVGMLYEDLAGQMGETGRREVGNYNGTSLYGDSEFKGTDYTRLRGVFNGLAMTPLSVIFTGPRDEALMDAMEGGDVSYSVAKEVISRDFDSDRGIMDQTIYDGTEGVFFSSPNRKGRRKKSKKEETDESVFYNDQDYVDDELLEEDGYGYDDEPRDEFTEVTCTGMCIWSLDNVCCCLTGSIEGTDRYMEMSREEHIRSWTRPGVDLAIIEETVDNYRSNHVKLKLERRKRWKGDGKVFVMEDGSRLYSSASVAFMHFFYHIYLWLVMPVSKWKSSQKIYGKVVRKSWGRRWINSGFMVPGFLREIHERSTESQESILNLL